MNDEVDCGYGRVRHATVDDLESLVQLENREFDTDRISRRQFRYLLNKANAEVLVLEHEGKLLANAVVLFSRATSIARLYSLVVDRSVRGKKLGYCLMKAVENEAWAHHRAYLRLEVRKDNYAAISFYERIGFRRLGELSDYYEDHMDALRYEKSLAPELHPNLVPVPYYEQSLDFTCGPASLMMAMKTIDPTVELTRNLELRLWREATTIFMTSGHGGCGPYGLALAAVNRSFRTVIYLIGGGVHLVDSVRSEHKKEVMRLVQEEMYDELCQRDVPILAADVSIKEIEASLKRGGIPLILISSWQIYHARVPHWVVITGTDESFVYVNDPFIDRDEGETEIDSIHMPIPREKFSSMAKYGKSGLQAMVVLYSG